MKFATHLDNGRPTFSVARGETLIPLRDLFNAAGLPDAPESLQALIDGGDAELNRVRDLLDRVERHELNVPGVPLSGVDWLPAVPRPSKVLAVAMNNRGLTVGAHKSPAGPMFFLKPPSSLIAHGAAIEIQPEYGLTFPELEVAAVIGKRARHISETEALAHVFGYTIVNDVTSQGLKSGDSIAVDVPDMRGNPHYTSYFDWRNLRGEDDAAVYLTYHTRSKGCDTFGPVGPWVTEARDIEDPNALEVRGYIDGEQFAEDVTSNYAHRIEKVISYASRYFTLEPGDLLLFGTSAKGVGRFKRAHLEVDMSKLDGSRIDIDISGLGRLSNVLRHVG